MQAGCEIWRLAHDAAFLRLASPYEIANYNQSGSDADPHMKRLGCGQGSNRFDQCQSSPHGPFGIIFVCLVPLGMIDRL